MIFDECFAALIAHEGDFADLENDPGGKTRFGVTEAVARGAGYAGDMRELPLSLAKTIYRSQYWDAVRGDELPDGVRYYVFDAAAASGVRQSVLWLQRALGVAADGVLGPVTLAAAHAANPDKSMGGAVVLSSGRPDRRGSESPVGCRLASPERAGRRG